MICGKTGLRDLLEYMISRDELEEQGYEISKVVNELDALLDGPVYCDAWTFDSFWLHRLLKANKCKPTFEILSARY
jgi:hypothetical protein